MRSSFLRLMGVLAVLAASGVHADIMRGEDQLPADDSKRLDALLGRFGGNVLAPDYMSGSPLKALPAPPATGVLSTRVEVPLLLRESLRQINSLSATIGDRKALQVIANLMAKGDARAKLAVANYLQRYPEDLAALQLAALQLMADGKDAQAQLALGKIVKQVPNYGPAQLLLGLSYLNTGKQGDARRHLQSAVRARVRHPSAYRYLAWQALRDGELSAATRLIEQAVGISGIPDKQVFAVHNELAELYRLDDNYAGVLTLFARFVESQPGMGRAEHVEAIARYFEAAVQTGQWDKAKVADALLQKSQSAYAAYPVKLSRARLAAVEGNVRDALALLASMESEDKGKERQRLLTKANILVAAKRRSEAMAALVAYRKLLGEQPLLAPLELYVNQMVQLGQGNRMIAELNKLTQAHPARLDYQYLLANVYLQAGDLTGTSLVANKMLKADPKYALGHYLQGVVAYNKHDNKAASAAFRRAVEIDPKSVDGWLALFAALHDHRQHDHSAAGAAADHKSLIPEIKKAIVLNPNSLTLRNELGITAYSGSQLEEALQAFDDVLRIAPNDVQALAMSAAVRADKKQQLDVAENIASFANKIAPENVAVLDVLGWTEIRRGKVKQGIEHCLLALKSMENDPAVQIHLGVGYAQLGEKDKAAAYVLAGLRGELPAHLAAIGRETLQAMAPDTRREFVMSTINGFGPVNEVGKLVLEDTPDGLKISVDATGLPPGRNSMHFHEKPTCEGGMKDGKRIAGLAAGPHYGHDHAAMAGMDMSKMTPEEHARMMLPKGDLPAVEASADGHAKGSVFSKRLKLSELRGRSLMVHQGEDKDGKSGPKVACVVID